ncbi:Hypothetical predicted protein [Paramuricea clavata]|uniref:BLOC-1-related complex subunit 7 n=1 Tax=Paramuricea clavata TaxID=317549 RepID=A0A6S7FRU5_PARCT|nr:Hypothetical predicted protein [Paramuricea clavata]
MAAEDENKRTKERCKRFTERVNVNITEAAKLAQHMIRASGSPDILSQTTKKFVHNENSIKSTEENIKKMKNLIGQMDAQYDEIHQRLDLIAKIDHQMHPTTTK